MTDNTKYLSEMSVSLNSWNVHRHQIKQWKRLCKSLNFSISLSLFLSQFLSLSLSLSLSFSLSYPTPKHTSFLLLSRDIPKFSYHLFVCEFIFFLFFNFFSFHQIITLFVPGFLSFFLSLKAFQSTDNSAFLNYRQNTYHRIKQICHPYVTITLIYLRFLYSLN